MNKEALERELAEFLASQKKEEAESTQEAEQSSMMWAQLAQEDAESQKEAAMKDTVTELIKELMDLKLPHQEMWDALDELATQQVSYS